MKKHILLISIKYEENNWPTLTSINILILVQLKLVFSQHTEIKHIELNYFW